MILFIDNYDSFTYNLVQVVGGINSDILVKRNDEISVEEIKVMKPSHIILSPGPGEPKDAGICIEVVKKIQDIPILGVCLGHQAICEAYGGVVTYANKLMHGKSSIVNIENSVDIFKGLEKEIEVARYHSLIGKNLPPILEVIGKDKNDEIMGVKHKEFPIYGVQFHPESILTPCGEKIIENFLKI